jgi:hypothetical protein
MEQPVTEKVHERTHFPLITGSPDRAPLTDQQVADALEQMAEEEMAHYASFM